MQVDIRIKELPPPHGGRLVERVVRDPSIAMKMMERCSAVYDIKPTLFKDVPVRNVYREIMAVCYGFFSPLEGSMTKAELESVLERRRLLSGWIFPYPILFDITKEDLQRLGVGPGDWLLIRLKGEPFAILEVEEVYEIDPKDIAVRTFGTPEKNPEVVKVPFDHKHPGYNIYYSMNPIVLAGKYTIINEPKIKEPFNRFWYPPKRCREEFKRRGWKTVIAHQTRNVPHTGHEALMKMAAYIGDDRPCDGIVVNAIIGAKRIGDYPDEAIVEGHEMLHLAGYIKPERHMVVLNFWDMRYGNPVESLLHAVMRQNLGISFHMFGRDHAALGEYYDIYAAQILWTKGIPSMGLEGPPYLIPGNLYMRPQNMGEFWYCPKCGEFAYSDNCTHKGIYSRYSGSFIRGLISEGLIPPPQMFRPEVYKVVVKWWRKFGYPFVNEKYLREKEVELEVDMPHMELPEKFKK